MHYWEKVPKLKKGKWFVRTRGSYLPMTPQAWLLHTLLFFGALLIILQAFEDNRILLVASVSMVLELIGLGAVFSYIASKKT